MDLFQVIQLVLAAGAMVITAKAYRRSRTIYRAAQLAIRSAYQEGYAQGLNDAAEVVAQEKARTARGEQTVSIDQAHRDAQIRAAREGRQ